MIKSYSKNIRNKDVKELKPCNCRVKSECSVNAQCQVTDVTYKCTVLSQEKPNKVYLGTAEGDFKKRFYNHQKLFNKKTRTNDITLSKHYLGTKTNIKCKPSYSMVHCKKVPPNSNISRSVYCAYTRNLNYLIKDPN